MIMPVQNKKLVWYALTALLLVNLAALVFLQAASASGAAKVSFLDVGQGDAIYIRSPRGNDVLIDGGPGDVVLSRLGRVMPFSDRTIELLVVTHPHADHIAGLVELLKRYKVERVLLSRVDYPSATYAAFLQALEQSGAEVIVPRLGQRIVLDREASMDVLFPFVGEFASNPKDLNDVSTVLRFNLGQEHILFTGDAGKGIENLLLLGKLPLSAQVLKVGHHGSRHSSGAEFVRAVSPRYAAIEVGAENSYGHPHEEVLAVLQEQRIEVLRTDEQGQTDFLVYPDRIEKQD